MPTKTDITRTKLIGRDGFPYHAQQELIDATNIATTLERPLLLTGEPGCGKTEFAHAAAHALNADLKACYIRSDSRAKDLLYQYDALRRFADVQSVQFDASARERVKSAAAYVTFGGLGEALKSSSGRYVVLIDEIDKAPRDFPNDLLRELDRRGFEVPELKTKYPCTKMPLIIITSNVERRLPMPFLRRCIFFHVEFPSKDTLTRIVQMHLNSYNDDSRDGAPIQAQSELIVAAFTALRESKQPHELEKPPSTSELIDWVRSLASTPNLASTLDKIAMVVRGAAPLSTLPALCCLLKTTSDHKSISAPIRT